MASDNPPQLQLSLPNGATSFKRSFEQFGFDLDSPIGTTSPSGQGANSASTRGDRNKRARSSDSSDNDSDASSLTSPVTGPSSSSSSSPPTSGSPGPSALDYRSALALTRPPALGQEFVNAQPDAALNDLPLRLPTPGLQDVDMPDFISTNLSRAPLSPISPATPDGGLLDAENQLRPSLERFHAFDAQISALRVSHSPTVNDSSLFRDQQSNAYSTPGASLFQTQVTPGGGTRVFDEDRLHDRSQTQRIYRGNQFTGELPTSPISRDNDYSYSPPRASHVYLPPPAPRTLSPPSALHVEFPMFRSDTSRPPQVAPNHGSGPSFQEHIDPSLDSWLETFSASAAPQSQEDVRRHERRSSSSDADAMTDHLPWPTGRQSFDSGEHDTSTDFAPGAGEAPHGVQLAPLPSRYEPLPIPEDDDTWVAWRDVMRSHTSATRDLPAFSVSRTVSSGGGGQRASRRSASDGHVFALTTRRTAFSSGVDDVASAAPPLSAPPTRDSRNDSGEAGRRLEMPNPWPSLRWVPPSLETEREPERGQLHVPEPLRRQHRGDPGQPAPSFDTLNPNPALQTHIRRIANEETSSTSGTHHARASSITTGPSWDMWPPRGSNWPIRGSFAARASLSESHSTSSMLDGGGVASTYRRPDLVADAHEETRRPASPASRIVDFAEGPRRSPPVRRSRMSLTEEDEDMQSGAYPSDYYFQPSLFGRRTSTRTPSSSTTAEANALRWPRESHQPTTTTTTATVTATLAGSSGRVDTHGTANGGHVSQSRWLDSASHWTMLIGDRHREVDTRVQTNYEGSTNLGMRAAEVVERNGHESHTVQPASFIATTSNSNSAFNPWRRASGAPPASRDPSSPYLISELRGSPSRAPNGTFSDTSAERSRNEARARLLSRISPASSTSGDATGRFISDRSRGRHASRHSDDMQDSARGGWNYTSDDWTTENSREDFDGLPSFGRSRGAEAPADYLPRSPTNDSRHPWSYTNFGNSAREPPRPLARPLPRRDNDWGQPWPETARNLSYSDSAPSSATHVGTPPRIELGRLDGFDPHFDLGWYADPASRPRSPAPRLMTGFVPSHVEVTPRHEPVYTSPLEVPASNEAAALLASSASVPSHITRDNVAHSAHLSSSRPPTVRFMSGRGSTRSEALNRPEAPGGPSQGVLRDVMDRYEFPPLPRRDATGSEAAPPPGAGVPANYEDIDLNAFHEGPFRASMQRFLQMERARSTLRRFEPLPPLPPLPPVGLERNALSTFDMPFPAQPAPTAAPADTDSPRDTRRPRLSIANTLRLRRLLDQSRSRPRDDGADIHAFLNSRSRSEEASRLAAQGASASEGMSGRHRPFEAPHPPPRRETRSGTRSSSFLDLFSRSSAAERRAQNRSWEEADPHHEEYHASASSRTNSSRRRLESGGNRSNTEAAPPYRLGFDTRPILSFRRRTSSRSPNRDDARAVNDRSEAAHHHHHHHHHQHGGSRTRPSRFRFNPNSDSLLFGERPMLDLSMSTSGLASFLRLGRPLGDYVRDEDFDSSYEGLLQLANALGDAKSRSVPEQVISSLPRGVYKEWATHESDARCPICLEDYAPMDPVLKLPDCTHWLHKECLEKWLHGASTCPVCRKRVKDSRSAELEAHAGPSGHQDDDYDESDDDFDSDSDHPVLPLPLPPSRFLPRRSI